jgi:hypothetical protein
MARFRIYSKKYVLFHLFLPSFALMLPIFNVIYPYFIHEKIGYSKRKNWSLDYSQMSSEMLRSELRNDEKKGWGESKTDLYHGIMQ